MDCINTPGSYYCACSDRYTLDTDQRTCIGKNSSYVIFVYLCDQTIPWINNNHGRPESSCDCNIDQSVTVFCPRESLALQTKHSPLYPLLSFPFVIQVDSVLFTEINSATSSSECSGQGQVFHCKRRNQGCSSVQRQVFHCKFRNQGCSFTRDKQVRQLPVAFGTPLSLQHLKRP